MARLDKANQAYWYYGQHGPAYAPIMIEWAHDARVLQGKHASV